MSIRQGVLKKTIDSFERTSASRIETLFLENSNTFY